MCLNPMRLAQPAKTRRAGIPKPLRLDPAITPGLMLEMDGHVLLERWTDSHILLMNDRPLIADVRHDGMQCLVTLRREHMPHVAPVRSHVLEADAGEVLNKWLHYPVPITRTVQDGGLIVTILIRPTTIPFVRLDC